MTGFIFFSCVTVGNCRLIHRDPTVTATVHVTSCNHECLVKLKRMPLDVRALHPLLQTNNICGGPGLIPNRQPEEGLKNGKAWRETQAYALSKCARFGCIFFPIKRKQIIFPCDSFRELWKIGDSAHSLHPTSRKCVLMSSLLHLK